MNKVDIKAWDEMLVPSVILLISAFFAAAPLIVYEGFIAGGWDLSHHLSKAYQVSSAMKEGVFYPRWLSLSNGGYGSPTTIFYSPLFYWITGVTNLFIPSLIISLKVTIFGGFFLSGIFMYAFLRNFCGHIASVAGGIAYQLLPYHTFNLYVREGMAETLAFMFLPLILNMAYKASTTNYTVYWICLSLSYAGLIFTHIVTAYIFTFVIAVNALFIFIKLGRPWVSIKFLLAFLFGISLSAVYLIPLFYERRYVHIEYLSEQWDYMHSFLYLRENNLSQFYIHLKLIVMLYALLAIISLLIFYYKNKRYGGLPAPDQFLFYLAVFAFSIFISTPLSTPIWQFTPELSKALFPWRWLMVSTLAISVLIGFAFDTFSFAHIKKDRFLKILTAVLYAFIIGNLYLSSTYIMLAKPMQEDMDIKDTVRNGEEIMFRPIWLTDKKKVFPKETGPPVSFEEESGTVDIVSWKSHSRLFKVDAPFSSIIRISTFYYPGWVALINGRGTPIGIEKDSGAMLLNLPPGKNTVLLEFRDTPLRKMAKWVSIISLFAAIFTLFRQGKKTVSKKSSAVQ